MWYHSWGQVTRRPRHGPARPVRSSGASVCVVSRITSRLSAAWAIESLPPWLPPRGRSFAIPATPSSANRRLQRPTLFWSVPSLAAIAWFVIPPAAVSTIRERSRSRTAALRCAARPRQPLQPLPVRIRKLDLDCHPHGPSSSRSIRCRRSNGASPDTQCFRRDITLAARRPR